VHGSLAVGFADIGEQRVKNIMRPLRVYQVMLAGTPAQVSATGDALRSLGAPRHRWWIAGSTLALVAGAAAWVLLPLVRSPSLPATDAQPSMSIAILPFTAGSESDADKQFAELLTNDVTTGVGANRWLTVAPSSLASAFIGKTVDLPAVGRQLNVRYVAEGEVRHIGDKQVVTLRLTDTKSRKQAWSDRREYDLAALAAKPDTAQLQLSRRLSNAVTEAETQRVAAEPTAGTPLDLVLRGDAAANAATDITAPREARKLFEAALRLKPNYVPALTELSASYDNELEFGPNPERRLFEQQMDALTGKAVSIDPSDGFAWYQRAVALSWLGRWDEALSASERAEALLPWSQGVLLWRSWIMISTGAPAEALALAQRAAAIDPPGRGWPQLLTCKSYLYLGQYADAVKACEKSAGLNNSWIDEVYLTAAYAQAGNPAKAKVARDELLKLQPGYTIERYRQTWYSGTPAFFALVEKHLASGLRKAGIPEQ
jgi:adenylate cyclase